MLGKPRLNRRAGTARLAVTVPGLGRLAISGNGARRAAAVAASAGTVQLLIRANGKEQKTLNRTGTVTINVKVTYTPRGGAATTLSQNVRLQKL